MCLECSGRHRALGVHISFVRSVSMDSWTEKQIQMMRLGGNDKLNDFLRKYQISKTTPIPQKYNAPAAMLYKDRLAAIVEGRVPPTELPTSSSSGADGIHEGSDPLPGESEADYVSRQRLLQERARERMRAKFGSSSGLSSGGKMSGIGSDPNYDPNKKPMTDSLADVSSKAFSFVSSISAKIGEFPLFQIMISKSKLQKLRSRSHLLCPFYFVHTHFSIYF